MGKSVATFKIAILCLLVAVAHGDKADPSAAGTSKPFIQNGDFEDIKIAAPFTSRNPAYVPGWPHTGDPAEALIWRVGYSNGACTITKARHGSQFFTLCARYHEPGTGSPSTPISA